MKVVLKGTNSRADGIGFVLRHIHSHVHTQREPENRGTYTHTCTHREPENRGLRLRGALPDQPQRTCHSFCERFSQVNNLL